MANGWNLNIWLNVGDKGRIWMTPSFLDGQVVTEATSKVENS